MTSCYFLASTYFHDSLVLSLSVTYTSTETLKESWYGMSLKLHLGPQQKGLEVYTGCGPCLYLSF